jgi:hypothetical protein
MKLKVCLAAGLLVVSSIPMFAADQAKKDAPQMSAEEKAAMEAMMKAGTPGPEHKKMAEMAGTFDAVVKMWGAPGMEPSTSKGVSKNTTVLGGRYLREDFTGEFMGMPFNGLGYSGYDNVTKKYFGTWIDSFSTGLMTSTGDCSGDTCTYTSTMSDPASGKQIQGTTKLHFESKDKHVMEMWGAAPDGTNFKMMEITYTRKK